ncbi:hypothetical protein FA95DRAFT_1662575, partial [Auriscalpium vulgare]
QVGNSDLDLDRRAREAGGEDNSARTRHNTNHRNDIMLETRWASSQECVTKARNVGEDAGTIFKRRRGATQRWQRSREYFKDEGDEVRGGDKGTEGRISLISLCVEGVGVSKERLARHREISKGGGDWSRVVVEGCRQIRSKTRTTWVGEHGGYEVDVGVNIRGAKCETRG